jgi:hypothetical protein
MAVLKSIYLKANKRLNDAVNGGKALRTGENSDGVAAIQAGLADLGHLMPKSTNHAKVLATRKCWPRESAG